MELTDRQLVRIAEEIRGCLIVQRNARYLWSQVLLQGINASMERLVKDQQGLHKAVHRNWYGSAERLTSRIRRVVQNLPSSIAGVERATASLQAKMPALRQIYEELNQAQEELGPLRYSRADQTLSVVTEPIELEGYYLGDFEIQLEIPKLAELHESSIFKVIALDPHPASTNDAVTHPHVSDEYLCAGDATTPIQTALSNGRVCDFFMLVRSVLNTYNPSSPYVSLNDWDGIPCYGCGYTTSEDEHYYCEHCDNGFCYECMSNCRSCKISLCQGCLTACQYCEKPYCASCLVTCEECAEIGCMECITDGSCPTCRERMENHDDDEETLESKEHTETESTEPAWR